MSDDASAKIEELKTTLIALVNEINDGNINIKAEQSAIPLKDLGLDSVGLLSFLVAIEDELGIEWSLDVDKKVFTTIDSLTNHLALTHG
ncbi:acyl carrier protein [Erwinia piriflorinigrans]|uniref:Carrier domain-containing protein n=1 Tax=Erwinia piriflorinigrans CFBP 5888 TaxID=1161919 RepID=V5Z9B0_9GAMM|nr:acyl carrier protein [Erwinia piriflorinigrans]CCG87611.1 hypothetical protein EPIR_2246 [Erwinia piriflorinigrans CFBP 5888]